MESHEETMDETETILSLEPGEFTTVEQLLSTIREHNLRNRDKITIELDDWGNGLLCAQKVEL